MANEGKTKLDKWIADAMADTSKEVRLTRLTLMHMRGDARGKEVWSHKIDLKASITSTNLANMFRGKAEAVADGLDGVQTFNLLSFYGKDEEEGFVPFMVRTTNENFSSGLATEGPSAEGQTMQRMRHYEMVMGQVYRRQSEQDAHQLRFIEMQNRMIVTAMQQSQDSFLVVRDLLMKQALDDHTRKMTEMQFARDTEERKKWISFAPVLINRIVGREIFPQSTEDTVLIEAIAEKMEPEHLQLLTGMGLTDMQLGPLAARVTEAMEKKRLEAEKVKALTHFRGDGADDVTGGMQ